MAASRMVIDLTEPEATEPKGEAPPVVGQSSGEAPLRAEGKTQAAQAQKLQQSAKASSDSSSAQTTAEMPVVRRKVKTERARAHKREAPQRIRQICAHCSGTGYCYVWTRNSDSNAEQGEASAADPPQDSSRAADTKREVKAGIIRPAKAAVDPSRAAAYVPRQGARASHMASTPKAPKPVKVHPRIGHLQERFVSAASEGATRKRKNKEAAKLKARKKVKQEARPQHKVKREREEVPASPRTTSLIFGRDGKSKQSRRYCLMIARLFGHPEVPKQAWLRRAKHQSAIDQPNPARTGALRRTSTSPAATAFLSVFGNPSETTSRDVAKTLGYSSDWEKGFADASARPNVVAPPPNFDFMEIDDSPLVDAALHGKTRVVLLLLCAAAAFDQARARKWVEAVGRCAYTALFAAAVNGHSDIVCMLGAAGANPHNWDAKGNTALGLAAEVNHRSTVKELLLLGCDPLELDRNGRSALSIALESADEKLEFTPLVSLMLAAVPSEVSCVLPEDLERGRRKRTLPKLQRDLVEAINDAFVPQDEEQALQALLVEPERPHVFRELWKDAPCVTKWSEEYFLEHLDEEQKFTFSIRNSAGISLHGGGGDHIWGTYRDFCDHARSSKAYLESIAGGAMIEKGHWDFEMAKEEHGPSILSDKVDVDGQLKRDLAMGSRQPRPFHRLINDVLEVSRKLDKGFHGHERRITRMYLTQMREHKVNIKWHQDKWFSQIILNVKGQKTFELHPPLKKANFWLNPGEIMSNPHLIRSVTLSEGDVLYLPAGWAHRVETPGQPFGCTVNFGIPPLTVEGHRLGYEGCVHSSTTS